MRFLVLISLLASGTSGLVLPITLTRHWSGGFQGDFCIPFTIDVTSWRANLTFSEPLNKLEIWVAEIESQSPDGREFVLVNKPFNANEHSGDKLCVTFLGHGDGDISPTVTLKMEMPDPTTLGPGERLRCMDCFRSPTHSQCSRSTKTCQQGEKCFIQKTEDVHGNTFYTAGCASQADCDFMAFKTPLLTGKREPLQKHTCGECCDTDLCTRHRCYVDSVSELFHHISQSTMSTTTSTTTTTTTIAPVPPVQCETCSGPLCGQAVFKTAICPSGKPYCMNTVVNGADGSIQIIKGCVSTSECRQKWWKMSSGKPECQTFDLKHGYPFDLMCSYCCTKDDCNIDFIPKQETLFEEHN